MRAPTSPFAATLCCRRVHMSYRRLTIPLFALVMLGFAVPLSVLFVVQRTLIYYPQKLTHEQFLSRVQTEFEGRATVLAGFDAVLIEPQSRPITATVIWFHGNAGLNVDRSGLAKGLTERGLRLILAEYPGYGARGGEPSEPAIVEDARALYASVAARYPESPLLLMGASLGSGVAAQLAARPGQSRAPARLILLTPYLSIAEVAAERYWMLPVRHLVKDVFDSAGAVASYAGPVAILVAGRDEVIGAGQGRLLADRSKARGPTSYVELPLAGHFSWPDLLGSRDWTELLGLPVAANYPDGAAAGTRAKVTGPPG
jgi:pimeloyl-ACP methyl ester carboxylesterase